MSSRITLRKAVLELLKKTGSNSTMQSQISENAEKQHDRNTLVSNEVKSGWVSYLNSYFTLNNVRRISAKIPFKF